MNNVYDAKMKGISYVGAFFILIAFGIAGIIFSGLITTMIWPLMFPGVSVLELKDKVADPAFKNYFILSQVIVVLLGFLIPTIITAKMVYKKPAELLGLTRPLPTPKLISLTVGITIAAAFLGTGLAALTEYIPLSVQWEAKFKQMESAYNEQVNALVSFKNGGEFLFSLIMMAFLPAIAEEIYFRAGLQNFLQRSIKKPIVAVIIVSLIFSLVHFSYYGFLTRTMLGVVLGLLYYYSGKLWLSILMHFINNAAAVTIIYVYTLQGKTITEAMALQDKTLWGLLALPVVVLLLYIFKKECSLFPEKYSKEEAPATD